MEHSGGELLNPHSLTLLPEEILITISDSLDVLSILSLSMVCSVVNNCIDQYWKYIYQSRVFQNHALVETAAMVVAIRIFSHRFLYELKETGGQQPLVVEFSDSRPRDLPNRSLPISIDFSLKREDIFVDIFEFCKKSEEFTEFLLYQRGSFSWKEMAIEYHLSSSKFSFNCRDCGNRLNKTLMSPCWDSLEIPNSDELFSGCPLIFDKYPSLFENPEKRLNGIYGSFFSMRMRDGSIHLCMSNRSCDFKLSDPDIGCCGYYYGTDTGEKYNSLCMQCNGGAGNSTSDCQGVNCILLDTERVEIDYTNVKGYEEVTRKWLEKFMDNCLQNKSLNRFFYWTANLKCLPAH
eukprot:TRINITY_DN5185_c0_g1_i1.p1 TRINITY_DN5185_c0_g1~~TRINITY_DN5185_c0_g1_i1.p1  ORF type:complete len:360 (+),score=54.58 TRINITY_DN5185_c0_g1_i1:36-1082(+)